MRHPALLLPALLSPDAARIGSLVIDPKHPHDEFHFPGASVLTDDDITESAITSLTHLLHNGRTSRLSVALAGLLSAKYGSQNQAESVLRTSLARQRQLKNSRDYFEAICKTKKTRKWLENHVLGSGAIQPRCYLIVGQYLVTDANIQTSATNSQTVAAQGKLTVSAAIGGNAVPSNVNPSLAAEHSQEQGNSAGYDAAGELLYAVEYRKIVCGAFFSKDIEKVTMEKGSRWIIMARPRDATVGEDEDAAEAILMESAVKEDFEFPCEEFEEQGPSAEGSYVFVI